VGARLRVEWGGGWRPRLAARAPGGAAESGDLPGMPGSMNLLMHMQCRSEK